MYIGRIVAAAVLFLVIAWAWRAALPETTLAVSLTLLGVCVFSAASFWFTHLLDRAPGTNFLYVQVLFDTLLVTWMVHLSGGQESFLSPLYILVIFAAAILLPFLGGILIGLLASILYFAAVAWGPYGSPEGVVLLQILLFSAVALLTGYVGDRLRQTGCALGAVETELRLLRLDTNDVLGSLNTGVLTVDGSGRLVYINPAAAEILSIEPHPWLGSAVIEKLDEWAPGLGWVIAQSIKRRMAISGFETGDLLNGTFVLSVSTTLLERPEAGDPPVTAIFQDITERKRMDTLERRAERLEAVAELSASLAHEIRNPLASIRSAVEQLTGGGMDPEDSTVLHNLVVRESNRLSRLLTEFLDFARVEVAAPKPVDFAALVRQAVELVRAHPDAEGRRLELQTPWQAEELTIPGAEDLLHRAVLNLVLNAAQWAGPGGRVEVAVDVLDSEILSSGLGARQLARLTVSDSGPGIPVEVVDHILDPFFTRRPGGTGLGLALVQRAVEAHGGAIFVDPPGEHGASFTLYLPTLATQATHPENAISTEQVV
ncbi:MAG TPA: ATP-binding protein [Longimicrobiaceae bacterium]|nr:ATP-binding protein [Longimicrobiaceae bacterium]